MAYELNQQALGGFIQGLNLDAGETPNFKREFEYIFNEVYKVQYATGKALQLFPVARGIDATAKTYGFQTGDRLGTADFVAEGSLDIPTGQVTGKEEFQVIKPIKTAFHYTKEDLARVGKGKFNIPSDLAENAVQLVFDKHNTAFWLGDTANGITGILNNSNIDGAAVSAGVGGVTWALKTPQEVLRDLKDAVNTMRNSTLRAENPNLLVLSLASYAHIETTLYNDQNLKTILEVFKGQFPEIKVDYDVTLNGAFSGGTNGFLIGTDNRMVIELIAPVPYQLGQPIFNGVAFTTIAEGRNGGAKITRPKAFLRRWGI